jgi:hypothetical protein
VWWNDAQDRPPPRARIGEAAEARRGGERGGGAEIARAARAVPADAGALARIPHRAGQPGVPAVGGEGVGTREELPRNATDSEHSTGWQLGQTRRRIAILSSRLERIRAQADSLEQQGRPDVAARQRAVLERFEVSLREMREQEQELLPLAERDGTMGEAERGYEEGETESERPTSPAVTPRP